MSYASGLICRSCNNSWPEKQFRLRCPDCDAPLEVDYRLDRIRRFLKRGWPQPNGSTLLKQWEKLLPLPHPELIARCSLGETQTPLVPANKIGLELGLDDLRFKIEIGPTLSLKDRGSSLCALKALEMGVEGVCVASSGNNASSVAAYAARAGLPSYVFVQRDTAPAKFGKMLAYGARVVRIDADLSAAGRLCMQIRDNRNWMECGGPNPYRISAKRLVAYEIVAQLAGDVPDAVFIPCGGCAGYVAAYSGFKELLSMGLIAKMPKLIGVQLAACDPVTRAFDQDHDEVTPVNMQPTFSDALKNNTPYWGEQAIRAARDSKGFFISVTDKEVAGILFELGKKEGLYLEPAGAVSVTGLKKVLQEKRLQGLRQVVCTLTGHGLNARPTAISGQKIPEPVAPDVHEVMAYLGRYN
jgi:threonine synthase